MNNAGPRRSFASALRRLSGFAFEHLLLLPVGAFVALVWANAAPESYFGATHAMAFAVNDVGMVFFFGLITKEVVEATAAGGVLHTWRRTTMPLIAALGAASLSALIHVRLVDALDEPALEAVWPVTLGTDIAVSYIVARLIFRRHPVIPFVLLLAIASDMLGVLAVALFQPAPDLHLTQGGVLVLLAIGIAMILRSAHVKNFWAYLLTAGTVSWFGFYRGGIHPAVALVPIVPFLPHASRDPGFLVDASPGARDTLSRFEIFWRYPAQIALSLFGFVNAGVAFHALEPGTIGLPIAVIAGRPIGILAAAGIAVATGLHLPQRVGWRDLLVVGFITAVGFSVALFLTAALLPPGQLRAETSMGVILGLAAVPLAFASARVLRVGRFGRT